ncbi:hypothetical protein B0J13DRAFT_573985 [Dactylonectria estremocensis]|uniref:Crystal protein ET79 n=1 Tax=Dactylonectria estremocensis TaxID=1079267 RepID=A0A9P9D7T7_9HYPO|nr:hypothetical protein B0J13DRAFT_573985 [Dactylonectria estremocensis]
MSPSRSTNITIINNTTLTLTLQSSELDDGIWSQGLSPMTTLGPDSQGTCQAESAGILTGDAGSLAYTSSAGTFTFSFDDPYKGSNSYSQSAPSGYTISRSGGGGDNAGVTWIITSD